MTTNPEIQEPQILHGPEIVQKVPDSTKKSTGSTWKIFMVIALILFSIFVLLAVIFIVTNQKLNIFRFADVTQPQPTTETVNVTNTIMPQTSAVPIEWLKYTYAKSDRAIEFYYPKGATITIDALLENGTCNTELNCGKLTLIYGNLTMTVDYLTGIGGLDQGYSNKFMIVSGNYNQGIAREYLKSEDITKYNLRYSKFNGGGQSFPIMSPRITYPIAEKNTYEYIADVIGSTYYDLEIGGLIAPIYGKAYLQTSTDQNFVNALIKVDTDGDETTIYSLDNKPKGTYTIDNYNFSPSLNYVLISVSKGGNGQSWAFAYSIVLNWNTGQIVTFDNNVTELNCSVVDPSQDYWKSDSVFTCLDQVTLIDRTYNLVTGEIN